MYQPFTKQGPLPAYSATCFSVNLMVSSKGQCFELMSDGFRLFSWWLPNMLPLFNSARQPEDCLLLLAEEVLYDVTVMLLQ